ncbi:nuclear receptor subfamily 0 group B member 1-like isoform X2 [Sinocyclocheilus anshuiensis]|uniref:nuclear receptor subfamily 0 group B member 1-like isoform X2 n=1 Tax=Sinocyclocheilus anshuiensis TaxID=1608454 RepID=UPI0007B7DE2D|nr:PREDICTED: nuclear receptor subfamily 0 group B member 1-like isoform X2 [Sinocyclocheilus anshuiensis]
MAYFDSSCHCSSERRQNSILYSILKNDSQTAQLGNQPRTPRLALSMRACACGSKTKVSLRSPQTTCKAASAVLVKTLKFVKNVPCFQELPVDDQHTLVRSSWAPLLVLGMAQDRIDFETSETQEPSMLQRILTSGQDKQDHQSNNGGVALTDVQDVAGLQCQHYIQGLQSEANQALNEYVKMIHRGDSARFAKLFLALCMLRSINANVVAGLFFKPVIGAVNMEELLLEMFYGK